MISRIKLSSNDILSSSTTTKPSFKIAIDNSFFSDDAELFLENFNINLDEDKCDENLQTITIYSLDFGQQYSYDSLNETSTRELFRIPIKRNAEKGTTNNVYNINPVVNYCKRVNRKEIGIQLKGQQLTQNKIINLELKILVGDEEKDITNYIKTDTSYNIGLLIYDKKFYRKEIY